jgi:hypothetical protein
LGDGPALPAAARKRTPLSTACTTALRRGSLSGAEKLSEMMSARRLTASSMPRTRASVKQRPLQILITPRVAPGAPPISPRPSRPAFAAAEPEVCVPWPSSSSQPFLTRRPVTSRHTLTVRSGWVGIVPVSITNRRTPAPADSGISPFERRVGYSS